MTELNQAVSPGASIECVDLNKRYGPQRVLHSVSFSIQPGKLVGFLGPNGAGKTTTIRILLGLLKPSSGTALVQGRSSRSEGHIIRRQIGYLPGDVHFYPGLTGRQTLKFLSGARGIDCEDQINRLAKSLDLDLTKRVRRYSTGMRQKLGLIQAMMHRPELLILDEPTSALDPLVRKVVFRELRKTVDEGRTIVFSSHSLAEVEELCDEVIILRAGRIVEQQTIEHLKHRALRRIRLTLADGTPFPTTFPAELNQMNRQGRSLTAAWTGSSTKLISWLDQLTLADVIIEKPDLNDLFLAYYHEQDPA